MAVIPQVSVFSGNQRTRSDGLNQLPKLNTRVRFPSSAPPKALVGAMSTVDSAIKSGPRTPAVPRMFGGASAVRRRVGNRFYDGRVRVTTRGVHADNDAEAVVTGAAGGTW